MQLFRPGISVHAGVMSIQRGIFGTIKRFKGEVDVQERCRETKEFTSSSERRKRWEKLINEKN